MIVIKLSNGENIEKALKRLKRKFNAIGTVKELRERESFRKPSEKKRETKKNAIYRQKYLLNEEKEK